MVMFILRGACHFVTWVIDELILLHTTILYYSWHGSFWGYTDAFSTSSFQI